jgi:hypothetical protein
MSRTESAGATRLVRLGGIVFAAEELAGRISHATASASPRSGSDRGLDATDGGIACRTMACIIVAAIIYLVTGT